MHIIIGNNVQTDGDVPNYEIMHSSIAYPVITRAALGKQVFLIQRCLHGLLPRLLSDDDSDMIFHGWNQAHDGMWSEKEEK